MKTDIVINTINNINLRDNIKGDEDFLVECINDIKNNKNFYLLLTILIYNKCNSLLTFLINNKINFNITKNGKNLLFYACILRCHKLTNFLSNYCTIQNKYAFMYIKFSLKSSIYKDKDFNKLDYYNSSFLLKLAYNGINILDYKSSIINDDKDEKYSFEDFENKYKKKINDNLKSYDFWNRRKNLVFIVANKKKSYINDKFTEIFANDLLINNIQKYM